MEDILQAALDHETEDVAGTPHKFAHLSVYDRATLQEADRQHRRKQLAQTLKDLEIDKPTAFATLSDFDADRPTESSWIEYVNSAPGKVAILHQALINGGLAEDVALEVVKKITWPAAKLLEVVAKLVNVHVASDAPSQQGDGSDPLATYGSESPIGEPRPDVYGDATTSPTPSA